MINRSNLLGRCNKTTTIFKILLSLTISFNFLGYLGAYFLTNFREHNEFKIGLPRPKIHKTPKDIKLKYITEKITISQQEWLETWHIKNQKFHTQGTIILFHGKGATKSQLLVQAQVFNTLNYETVLVDFRGAGGSTGNDTTIGVRESEDVAIAFNHIKQINSQSPVILYGISMGSAAILRAIAKQKIKPDGIILELPFARLLTAVRTRLPTSDILYSPMAELIVFWGGIQHKFNGFTHNPVDFARQVNCPTLILHGKQDSTTSIEDVNAIATRLGKAKIANNINTQKKLVIFPSAGHELLVRNDFNLWTENVASFLAQK